MNLELIEAKKEKARQRASAWYYANKERAIRSRGTWQLANPEKRLSIRLKSQEKLRVVNKEKKAKLYLLSDPVVNKAKREKYYSNNKEKLYVASRKWILANPEKVKIYKIANYKNNKAAWASYAHNRRARKLNNGGTLSKNLVSKLLIMQKGKCAICRLLFSNVGKHLDHIVPLAKGGANEDYNAQLLCPLCNLKKGARDPLDYMQSLGFLL